MSESFNPYAVWLGLPPDLRSPDYYQLLQIRPGEDDPHAIVAAADRAMARVRGHRPGQRAAQWATLLDELANAKKCLTDPASRAAYDQQLRDGESDAAAVPQQEQESTPVIASVNQNANLYPPGMAPSDVGASQAKSAKRPSSRSPMDPVSTPDTERGHRHANHRGGSARGVDPMAPIATPDAKRLRQRTGSKVESAPVNPHAYPPGTDVPGRSATRKRAADDDEPQVAERKNVLPGGDELPPSQPVNAHVAPPRRQESSILPIFLGVAAALAILTLALLFLALQRGKAGESGAEPPAVASRPPTRPAPGSTKRSATTPRPGEKNKTKPSNPRVRPSPSTTGTTEKPSGTPADESRQTPVPATGSPPPGDGAAPPGDATEENPATPETADSPPVDPDAIDDPFMDVDDPGMAAQGSGNGDAAATGPPLTAAELEQLSKTLLTARAALGDLEFRIARAELEKAGTLARLPEHRAVLMRLDQLTVYAERFWTTVRQAMQELRGTEELTIGDSGQIVIVVEVKPEALTIRHNGNNKTYLLADMPPGLALAIADRALDASTADAALLKGACLGAMKNPQQVHLEEARRYWESARQNGADVDQLLQTLTDSYALK